MNRQVVFICIQKTCTLAYIAVQTSAEKFAFVNEERNLERMKSPTSHFLYTCHVEHSAIRSFCEFSII